MVGGAGETKAMKTSSPPTLSSWWLLWLGFLAYGGLNTGFLFGLSNAGLYNLVGAAIIVVLTAGLAALCWRLGAAMLGYGLIVGYVLMTIGSGGSCTLLRNQGSYEVLNGIAVFVIAAIAGIVILLVASLIQVLRKRS
jgi:hypothetical protein